MKKNKKLYVNLGLLSFFIWLLVFSYNSSKRKPENVSELLNDFSWLHQWPKWLDLPLMKYINIVFKKLNESYGWIFEAINNFLLWQLMTLKNFLILAPWPLVVLGVAVIAYFASGRKVGTTVFVGVCTFFYWFSPSSFLDKGNRNNFNNAN